MFNFTRRVTGVRGWIWILKDKKPFHNPGTLIGKEIYWTSALVYTVYNKAFFKAYVRTKKKNKKKDFIKNKSLHNYIANHSLN